MKFIYIDESGGKSHSGVFTMFGIMVDAYKLRKVTSDFDQKLETLFKRHSGGTPDLKTSKLISGSGGWKVIGTQERKNILKDICHLAVNEGKIFGIGLSFESFDTACRSGHGQPKSFDYWLAGAAFIACLVQKKMQGKRSNKGHTIFIIDDNMRRVAALSDLLYEGNSWLDGLYQGGKSQSSKQPPDRFNRIINAAFAIKSNHSSLIQFADAISYVYRRHLELQGGKSKQSWIGEKIYYEDLVKILESKREKLGRCPDEPSVKFYNEAKHSSWNL